MKTKKTIKKDKEKKKKKAKNEYFKTKISNVLNNVSTKGPELKSRDIYWSSDKVVFDNNEWTPLNVVQTGTNFFNRIGKSITMKSIRIKGYVWPDVDELGSELPEVIRMSVIYDRQPSGAGSIQYTDVYKDYKTDGSTISTEISSPNPVYFERFAVLLDEHLTYNNTSNGSDLNNYTVNTTNTSQGIYFDKYVPLKGLLTNYSNDAGVITTGALWINFQARYDWSEVDPSHCMKYSFSARLRFYDS